MTDIQELNNNDEPVKRGRGRPRKIVTPGDKPPRGKPGRKRLYDHRYKQKRLEWSEYERLLDIERKYNDIMVKFKLVE